MPSRVYHLLTFPVLNTVNFEVHFMIIKWWWTALARWVYDWVIYCCAICCCVIHHHKSFSTSLRSGWYSCIFLITGCSSLLMEMPMNPPIWGYWFCKVIQYFISFLFFFKLCIQVIHENSLFVKSLNNILKTWKLSLPTAPNLPPSIEATYIINFRPFSMFLHTHIHTYFVVWLEVLYICGGKKANFCA